MSITEHRDIAGGRIGRPNRHQTPFLFDHFVDAATERPLAGAAQLAIEGKTCWAIGPVWH